MLIDHTAAETSPNAAAPAAPDTTRPRAARDWRPSVRAKGTALAVGGALYSVSHMLNLLGSTPTLDSVHEVAGKMLFGIGALLIMAGLGSLMVQFARSPLGVLGVQLTWFGMLYMPLSTYTILYIYPVIGWEGIGAIDELAIVPTLLTIPTVILGPIVLAIAAWRHRVIAWWNACLFLVSSAALGLMVAVPEWEPPLAIGSTIVFGLAYCAAGLRARRWTA